MKFNSLFWTSGILQFFTWTNAIGSALLLGFLLISLVRSEINTTFQVMALYVVPMIISSLLFALLFHFTAKGLQVQERWARYSTIGIGVILLFGYPVGTVIGLFFLYAMLIDWPKQVILDAEEPVIESSDSDLTPKS